VTLRTTSAALGCCGCCWGAGSAAWVAGACTGCQQHSNAALDAAP
jgi:hypothetical protein